MWSFPFFDRPCADNQFATGTLYHPTAVCVMRGAHKMCMIDYRLGHLH